MAKYANTDDSGTLLKQIKEVLRESSELLN